MKKYQLILIVALICRLSIAQQNEILNFGISNSNSFIENCIIDPSGNTIVPVRVDDQLHIASFDANNNLNWTKILLSSPFSILGEAYTSDNGTFYIKTLKHIFKMDYSGNVIWSKEIESSGVAFTKGCALPNGGLAVMTSSVESSIVVFDPNGNISWSKGIESSSGSSAVREILITPQNNIITYCLQNGAPQSVLFTVFDLSGNILSDKQYEYDGNDFTSSSNNSATLTTNGHLYFTGYLGGDPFQPGTRDMVVYHFDENLNFVNGKRFGHSFDDEGIDLVEDEDGNLIAIGSTKTGLSSTRLLKVLKLTPDLDTLSTKHYGDTVNDYFFKSIHRTGSVIHLSGHGSHYLHFGNKDGYVIKTSKDFDLSCGLYPYQTDVNNISMIPANHAITYPTVSFTFLNYSNLQLSNLSIYQSCSDATTSIEYSKMDDEEFTLFPNPFSYSLKIKSNQVFNLVQLYSSNGKFVKQQNVNHTETTLNCSDLNAGVYFIRIVGDEFVINKKLVKE